MRLVCTHSTGSSRCCAAMNQTPSPAQDSRLVACRRRRTRRTRSRRRMRWDARICRRRAVKAARRRRNRLSGANGFATARRPISVGVRPDRTRGGIRAPMDAILQFRSDPSSDDQGRCRCHPVLGPAEFRRTRRAGVASRRTAWCDRAARLDCASRPKPDRYRDCRRRRGTANSSTVSVPR